MLHGHVDIVRMTGRAQKRDSAESEYDGEWEFHDEQCALNRSEMKDQIPQGTAEMKKETGITSRWGGSFVDIEAFVAESRLNRTNTVDLIHEDLHQLGVEMLSGEIPDLI